MEVQPEEVAVEQVDFSFLEIIYDFWKESINRIIFIGGNNNHEKYEEIYFRRNNSSDLDAFFQHDCWG